MIWSIQIVGNKYIADFYAGGYRLFRGIMNLDTLTSRFRSDPARPFIVPGIVLYRLYQRFYKFVYSAFFPLPSKVCIPLEVDPSAGIVKLDRISLKYSYFGSRIYQTFEARQKQSIRFFESLYNSYDLPERDPFLKLLSELVISGAFSIKDAQCAFYEYFRHLPGLYYGAALYLSALRTDFDVPFIDFQIIKFTELWQKNLNIIESPLVVLGSSYEVL